MPQRTKKRLEKWQNVLAWVLIIDGFVLSAFIMIFILYHVGQFLGRFVEEPYWFLGFVIVISTLLMISETKRKDNRRHR